jgi:hypothetical protein
MLALPLFVLLSIANPTFTTHEIRWQPSLPNYERIELRIADPRGEVRTLAFAAGEPVSFALEEATDAPIDGAYTYELRAIPRFSGELKKQLAEARERGETPPVAEELLQSGAFVVANGAIVTPGARELPRMPRIAANARPPATPGTNDQVIPDDLIVQGSTCVGLDCVNGEAFGFDTIRIKEINTRIKFEDTSSTAGFASNDWELRANDDASGGMSKFTLEDVTATRTPFTVVAGATTNSIYVQSNGRVGFRTNAPLMDLHINTSNTPAIRFEQNASGGFTAQSWDVLGNEANFAVRDVTAGNLMPFKIRPGAPTDSLYVNANGLVGLGGVPTAITPYDMPAQVLGADQLGNFIRIYNSEGTYQMGGTWMPASARTSGWLFGTNNSGNAVLTFGSGADEDDSLTDAKDTGDGITILASNANVGINCNNPGSDFVISATTNCSGSQSSINAGAAMFSVTSSRTMKENLEPLAVPDLLDRIAGVGVYRYDFKQGPKDRVGLIAEDFHQVFERGSDQTIDGNEVQMALWLAVQELTARVKELESTRQCSDTSARNQP